jgi:hypothetical protein
MLTHRRGALRKRGGEFGCAGRKVKRQQNVGPAAPEQGGKRILFSRAGDFASPQLAYTAGRIDQAGSGGRRGDPYDGRPREY